MFLSDVVQVRTAEKDRLVLIIGGGPGHGPDRLASGGRSLRTSRPTRRCWVTSTLCLARDCWRTSTICWSWRCARGSDGRPAPRGGKIDSQSGKTTERGGPRGFDAGNKIKGRKRHIVTDTEGCLVGVQVHAADIQDRDGAPDLLASIRSLYTWLRHASPMAAMRVTCSATPWPRSVNGPSKSSSALTPPNTPSNFYLADGWSNEPSPGPTAAAGSPRTSKPPSKAPSPESSSSTSTD